MEKLRAQGWRLANLFFVDVCRIDMASVAFAICYIHFNWL